MNLSHIVAGCGSLDDPLNGHVSHPETHFGSIANYECDAGYDIVGEEQRVCLETKQWNGSVPTCIRK